MAITPTGKTNEGQLLLFAEVLEDVKKAGDRLAHSGAAQSVRRLWNAAVEKGHQVTQSSLAQRLLNRKPLDIELRVMERVIEEPAPNPPRKQPSEIPSCQMKDLVHELRKRRWSDFICIRAGSKRWRGRGYLPADSDADKRRLARLIKNHNGLFANQLGFGLAQDCVGFVERLDLDPPNEVQRGDTLYVRADIHSDLSSLLAQLEMHQRDGDMNERFLCRPGFHLIFLGDYLDRGANDIEVLTVLLSLHIANPDSVHLLRGNHENLQMASEFSPESDWMKLHANAFATLYRSFPLAICAALQGQTQHVHFSHGLFPTWMQIWPLFEAGSSRYIEVPHLSPSPAIPPKETPEENLGFWRQVVSLIRLNPSAEGYLWSDVRQKTGPSERGASGCLGCSLSPDDIYAYGQVAGGNIGTLEAFVRGHEHIPKEWTVCRKGGSEDVLVTTLPMAPMSGPIDLSEGEQRSQGVFFTPSFLVRDWKKTLAIMEGDGVDIRFVKDEKSYGMFDRMFSN